MKFLSGRRGVRDGSDDEVRRLSDRVDRLNDRVTRAEGGIAGGKESKAAMYSLIATIGVVITIVQIVAAVLNGTGGT
jgi:hypothetical protein